MRCNRKGHSPPWWRGCASRSLDRCCGSSALGIRNRPELRRRGGGQGCLGLIFSTETSTEALMASAYLGAPLIVDSFAGGGGDRPASKWPSAARPTSHQPQSRKRWRCTPPTIQRPHHLVTRTSIASIRSTTSRAKSTSASAWFRRTASTFPRQGRQAPSSVISAISADHSGMIERIQKSGGRVDVVIMENVEELRLWAARRDQIAG